MPYSSQASLPEQRSTQLDPGSAAAHCMPRCGLFMQHALVTIIVCSLNPAFSCSPGCPHHCQHSQTGRCSNCTGPVHAGTQLSDLLPRPVGHTNCLPVFLQAVKLYSQAINVDKPASILFQKRAAAHSALGHHKLALTDLTAAIDLDPKQLSGYLHRSGPACAACAQALKCSSMHQDLLRRLTRSSARAGGGSAGALAPSMQPCGTSTGCWSSSRGTREQSRSWTSCAGHQPRWTALSATSEPLQWQGSGLPASPEMAGLRAAQCCQSQVQLRSAAQGRAVACAEPNHLILKG